VGLVDAVLPHERFSSAGAVTEALLQDPEAGKRRTPPLMLRRHRDDRPRFETAS